VRDWATFNAAIIEEFRANDGVVARFGGLPMIVLHTVGARSGEPRPTPLIPVFEGDDMFVFATAGGAPTDPAWCANLRAHPRIAVETADSSFTADLIELPTDEAQRMIDERATTTPQLAAYVESAAPRRIPVFAVSRVD
jgi:deazaflavin-dependent oxidoreductase (nitroreductase family)